MIKMCVRFYPKYDVELTWSSLRSGFTYDPDARICIRCGGPLRPRLEENARSRVMNVQICPECGIDEALRDARDAVLPMSEWYIVKNHYFGEMYDPDTAVLMPNCRFSCLFCARQKRLPPDNADYAFCRKDKISGRPEAFCVRPGCAAFVEDGWAYACPPI